MRVSYKSKPDSYHQTFFCNYILMTGTVGKPQCWIKCTFISSNIAVFVSHMRESKWLCITSHTAGEACWRFGTSIFQSVGQPCMWEAAYACLHLFPVSLRDHDSTQVLWAVCRGETLLCMTISKLWTSTLCSLFEWIFSVTLAYKIMLFSVLPYQVKMKYITLNDGLTHN